MSAETLQMISVIAFILGGILLAVAILLFFVLDVRGLIDDLNGKTAVRQIQQLREQNRSKEGGGTNRVLFEVHTEEEKTTLMKLLEKATTFTEKEEETTLLAGNRLVVNEIIVHTKEKIC